MTRWLGTEHDAAAADRILDAAGELFASKGVSSTGMADIARATGCSRATVYRYFEDRLSLRRAFVHREARRIADEVADEIRSVLDPTERFVEAVLRCIGAVRADPVLMAWFSGPDFAIAGDLATESDVIAAIGASFLDSGQSAVDDLHERARWTVRVMVSLLATPEAQRSDERALVARFLAPVVLDRTTV